MGSFDSRLGSRWQTMIPSDEAATSSIVPQHWASLWWLDDLQQLTHFWRTVEFEPKFLQDGCECLHEGVVVLFRVPHVEDVQDVAYQPRGVAALAGGMPRDTALLHEAPSLLVRLPSVTSRRVDDVHGDGHDASPCLFSIGVALPALIPCVSALAGGLLSTTFPSNPASTGQDLSAPTQLDPHSRLAPSGRLFRYAPRAPSNSGQQTRCLWFAGLSPRRPSEAGGSHRQELQDPGVDARAVLDQLQRLASGRLRLDGCYLNGR